MKGKWLVSRVYVATAADKQFVVVFLFFFQRKAAPSQERGVTAAGMRCFPRYAVMDAG